MNDDLLKEQHQIENCYKMGKVLMIKDEYDNALNKYTQFCKMFQSFILKQDQIPGKTEMFCASLYDIGEIYLKKKQTDKALEFFTLRRKFLEFFVQNPEVLYKGPNLLTIPNANCSQRNEISDLFKDMNVCFETPTNTLTDEEKSSILKEFQKKVQEEKEKEMKESAKTFREIAQKRKEEYEKSLSARIFHFLENPNNLFTFLFIISLLIASIPLFIFLKTKAKAKDLKLRTSNDCKIRHHDTRTLEQRYKDIQESENILNSFIEEAKKKTKKTDHKDL